MDRVHVMQLVQAFRNGQLHRRHFLRQATVAVGSLSATHLLLAACAATPADAPAGPVVQGEQPHDAMTLTSSGLLVGSVEYPGPGPETLTGYLAQPGEGAAPAVVVIQEWWGVNEHIKDVTRRFAAEGFVALAPDLYHGVVVSEPDEARKQVMELDMQAAVQEISAAMDFLAAQSNVAGRAVGVVGFCMGGGLALRTAASAATTPGAVVAFYGRPLPAEEAGQVTAPVLGLFGANDSGIPVDEVNLMEEALTAAGVENEIHIYEGAGHAFFNDTRPAYDAEAAADAWERTLRWFREHLSG